MKIPPNLLRTQVEDFEHSPNWLSTKQLERQKRILNVGRHLLAIHGLRNLRICDLALAMKITAAAFRFHFADLDALLIEILKEHGKSINKAIGDILHTDPDALAKRRAAYLAATRATLGNLNEAQLLLTRDAPLLSEENYTAIQQSHDQFGIILAGKLDPEVALTLLDAPRLDPARIHTMIATLEGSDPACLAPLPVAKPREVKLPTPEQLPPEQPLAPTLSDVTWSDDLAQIPDNLLQTYPDGETPGAWIYNQNMARSPPRAARG
jgi:AcrR family transcriptional regulator